MARGPVKAGEAYIELGVRSAVEKGLKKATANITRAGAIMSGGAVAALTAPIMAASRAEDTLDRFNTVFGESAAEMDKWARETARAMGMPRGAMRGMTADIQDMLVPMGVAPKQAELMSKQMATLAVDMGSFRNMNPADVHRDLQSALAGSTEVMNKYGVVIRESIVNEKIRAMGLDTSTAAAEQTAKVQARLQLIMEGTTKAQGDALRTSDSFNNRIQALQSSLADLAATLGGPMLDDAGFLVATLTAGINAAESFAASNTTLVSAMGQATMAVGLLGGSLLVVAGAAKAASIAVAGWNTVVTISTNIMKVYRAVVLTMGAAWALYQGGANAATAATIALAAAQKQSMLTTKILTMAMTALGTVTTIFTAAGGGLVGVLAVMKAGLLAVAGAAATAWTAVLGPLALIVAAIAAVGAAIWGVFKLFQKVGEVRERLAVNEAGVGFRDESLVDAEKLQAIEAEIEQERMKQAQAEQQRMDDLRSRAAQILEEQMSGAEKRKQKMAEIAELEKEGLLTAEQAERARQEAFTAGTKALQNQIVALTKGEEAAKRLQLANEGLTQAEIDYQMELQKRVDALEGEKEFDARMLALEQELDIMKMTTDEARKQKFLNEGFTDAQAEKLAGLEKELEIEKEKTREKEKQKREEERERERKKKEQERELERIKSTYTGVKQGLETERETAQRNHAERMKAIDDAEKKGVGTQAERDEQRRRSAAKLQEDLDAIAEKADKKRRDALKKISDNFKSVVQSLETEQETAQRTLKERMEAIRAAEEKGVATPEEAAQARLRARAAFNKEMMGGGATIAGTFSAAGAMLMGGGRGGTIQERQLRVQEQIAENTAITAEKDENRIGTFGA